MILYCILLYRGILLRDDSKKYAEFCRTTYILPDSNVTNKFPLEVRSDESKSSMRDILLDFISHCIRQYPKGYQEKDKQNILALGYRVMVSLSVFMFIFCELFAIILSYRLLEER